MAYIGISLFPFIYLLLNSSEMKKGLVYLYIDPIINNNNKKKTKQFSYSVTSQSNILRTLIFTLQSNPLWFDR